MKTTLTKSEVEKLLGIIEYFKLDTVTFEQSSGGIGTTTIVKGKINISFDADIEIDITDYDKW